MIFEEISSVQDGPGGDSQPARLIVAPEEQIKFAQRVYHEAENVMPFDTDVAVIARQIDAAIAGISRQGNVESVFEDCKRIKQHVDGDTLNGVLPQRDVNEELLGMFESLKMHTQQCQGNPDDLNKLKTDVLEAVDILLSLIEANFRLEPCNLVTALRIYAVTVRVNLYVVRRTSLLQLHMQLAACSSYIVT